MLCNCDDPYESNFFKYFALHFNHLGLKKLICTCYNGSPIQGDELALPFDFDDEEPKKIAHKVVITEVNDLNGDGAVDLSDVRILLQNDKNVLSTLETGDFRSQECIELLKEADIVVTNPPFSLFREYIAQLMEYEKRFLIIGPVNAITYKEVFPLIKNNIIWLGYGFNAGNAYFSIPETNKEYAAGVYDANTNLVKFRNCHWFTNLDHKKRHEELDLVCRYSSDEYPTYDNYEAIEVGKTADIPYDYQYNMGVPITFIDKYNPDQFEIIGMAKRGAGDPALKSKVYTKDDYPNYSDLNATPTLMDSQVTGSLTLYDCLRLGYIKVKSMSRELGIWKENLVWSLVLVSEKSHMLIISIPISISVSCNDTIYRLFVC